MPQFGHPSLDRYLEKNREEILDEHTEYWEMSPCGPDKLEGFRDTVVEYYSLSDIRNAESAEITDIKTRRGGPHVTFPESYTGTIVIGLYTCDPGSTPNVSFPFEVDIDRENDSTHVTVQPEAEDSLELEYDQSISPSRLKGLLEEDIS